MSKIAVKTGNQLCMILMMMSSLLLVQCHKYATQDDINKIIQTLPVKRQNLLFSATLSDDLDAINQIILRDPVIIKIEPEPENIDLITQTAYHVEDEKKGPLLRYLIKQFGVKQVLVFTSSTYKADNVADKLRKNGIDARMTCKMLQARQKQILRTIQYR